MKLTTEQQKLVEENHNLVYKFLWKYELDIDEWYDVAVFGLINAVLSFDPKKGKLSTLAYLSMQQRIAMEKRKLNAHKRRGFTVSLEQPIICGEPITILDTLTNPCDDVENNTRFYDTSKLTQRQRTILHLFSCGLAQTQIGARLRLSQAQISREKTKIKKILL